MAELIGEHRRDRAERYAERLTSEGLMWAIRQAGERRDLAMLDVLANEAELKHQIDQSQCAGALHQLKCIARDYEETPNTDAAEVAAAFNEIAARHSRA